ncbi:MAG: LysM peptidoglycan-binding domain-containing protein [Candidatus Latescibacterota bacterium]
MRCARGAALVLCLLVPVCAAAARRGDQAVHVVRRGETLSAIAARHGIPLADLQSWNGLSSDVIQKGQQLRLVPPSGPRPEWHVVQPGETLSAVAATYGLPVARLRRLNRLRSDVIQKGQRLRLAEPGTPRHPAGAPAGTEQATVHVVGRGETLSSIAQRHGVPGARLAELNDLPSSVIRVGQRLRVPPPTAVALPGEATGDLVIHEVHPGDTLAEVARRYGASPDEVRHLNGLPSESIRAGQRLHVPRPATGARPGARPADGVVADTPAPPAPVVQEPAAPPPGAAAADGKLAASGAVPAAGGKRGIAEPPLGTAQEEAEETLDPDGQGADGWDPWAGAPEAQGPAEYVVRPGDYLTGIAARFDLGLGLLRQLNHLRSDVIQPGQRLRLRPTDLEQAVHVVQRGETLSGIAQHYRLQVPQLCALNDIRDGRIFVGQKLRLREAPRTTHIVEPGDALWEIARAYGMGVEELKALNDLASDHVYPGQELRLAATSATRYDTYRVLPGDYLGQIARLHQMSVAELKEVNGLRTSVIHPGAQLRVRPLLGATAPAPRMVDWKALEVLHPGLRPLLADNGPYYFQQPQAGRQEGRRHFESYPGSPMEAYGQACRLWAAFAAAVDQRGPLGRSLEGWYFVLDPGHGGLDPGAIVPSEDGNGQTVYVVEDEYVHDLALRVYVLLRLHGAEVGMTILSPNHLIRQNLPATRTFVNEKNEVYNSLALNQMNDSRAWPRGGNLTHRVRIARQALARAPAGRRIFLSFHADIEPRAPQAPLVLYYESRDGRRRDRSSYRLARALLPALGAGARVRGQALGVLRENPADLKVLLELRNLAYRDHVWAVRFEQLRQRDAEKVVQGILDYVRARPLSASR